MKLCLPLSTTRPTTSRSDQLTRDEQRVHLIRKPLCISVGFAWPDLPSDGCAHEIVHVARSCRCCASATTPEPTPLIPGMQAAQLALSDYHAQMLQLVLRDGAILPKVRLRDKE